ncbi:MAG: glutathione synthase, partial [Halofilum sp. (in: g-proteobacteria)]
MTLRIGFVMDPLASITPKKDSTLALMLAAQARGWQALEIHVPDLALADGAVGARMREVTVYDDEAHWFDAGAQFDAPLTELDAVL